MRVRGEVRENFARGKKKVVTSPMGKNHARVDLCGDGSGKKRDEKHVEIGT